MNEIFRIFAHEKVLIRVTAWKTAIPIWATAKLSGTPSISLAGCILMPYNSHRRAVSSKFKSASAGVCPLKWYTKNSFVQLTPFLNRLLLISNRFILFYFFSVNILMVYGFYFKLIRSRENFFTYTCFLWFSIIFRCIEASWCGTNR